MTTSTFIRMSVVTAACGALCGIATATPTFTGMNPPPGAELGHNAILGNMYGGTWSVSGIGPDRTNGSVLASRISDAGLGGAVSLMPGAAAAAVDDALWSGHQVEVTVKAKYAGDSSVFGWFDDTQASPVFIPIINTSVLNSPVTVTISPNFRWGLSDLSTGRLFTSRGSDNESTPGGGTFDQLVSYRVTAPSSSGGPDEIAIFWEDRIASQGSDYDFNDAAIVVRSIPAPSTGLLAAAGVLGITARRRRRA